jgi:geranylgeranyl diphosphate synthase type II
VHDDLPAMDNDDFRRGRLSVHRRFDEALAILAGDALLADAFFHASHGKNNTVEILKEIAAAAGSQGLVGGQAEDLNRENKKADAKKWLRINEAKTSRLFEASAAVGALSVGATKQQINSARIFGCSFGHAFQIMDDLKDNGILVHKNPINALRNTMMTYLDDARAASKEFGNKEGVDELIYLTFANCC